MVDERLNFNPKGGLYGVVDLLTEVGGAVLRVGSAQAPQIRLGTGYIEKTQGCDSVYFSPLVLPLK